jgi:hypothetical protein
MERDEPSSHSAIIEVNENEVADFDAMALMVDAPGGDYSVDVRLVSTSSPPEIQNVGGQPHHTLAGKRARFSSKWEWQT